MNRNEKDFDIDKEFSRQMQDAAYVYSKEKYRMTPEDDAFIKRLVSDRRKSTRRKVMKVVAVVMLTVTAGVSSVLWMNDDGVYGGRHVMDKCISVISAIDIAEEVDDDGLVTQVITVSNENDIAKLKKYVDHVHGPSYIPGDYVFDTLKAYVTSDSTILEYTYIDPEQGHDNEILFFVTYYGYDPDFVVRGDLYKSDKTGQEMYVDEVKDTGEFIATEVTDTYSCTAAGKGKRITGIRMVESIREY